MMIQIESSVVQPSAKLLSERDIIVLSDDWEGLPNSTMHLVRHLLPQNRIFWFNLIGRLPGLSWYDAKKVVQVIRSWASHSPKIEDIQGKQQGPQPVTVTPLIVPWFKAPVRKLNRWSLCRKVQQICQQHDVSDPIVLSSLPAGVDLFRCVDEAVKIYYCVDDWGDYPGINQQDWLQMEQEAIELSQGVVATSQALVDKVPSTKASLYLPQGVDVSHFSAERFDDAPIASLEQLPKPIVGFFGMISPWIDLKVIATLAEKFPQISIVMIGRSEIATESLPKNSNIHFLGPVPYAELPQYARYFDVGLIPFVNNKLTRAVNPLKLMEYFALGLPVLSTKLPEMESCDGPIFLAKTPAEFCSQLADMLQLDSNRLRGEAEAIAQENTWHARAVELSRFITECEKSQT